MVILSIIDPRLSSPSIGFLARLHQAANGNPGPLRDLINGFYSGPPVRPEVYSSGLHAATLCADIPDMPWGNAAVPLAGRKAALARAIQRIQAAASWPFPPATAGAQGVVQECQYWPPARPDPAPPDRNHIAASLLFNLLLAGGTPPDQAQRAIRRAGIIAPVTPSVDVVNWAERFAQIASPEQRLSLLEIAVQLIADGSYNAVIESNPRFGPLAFQTLQKFENGEPIPASIVISDDQYDETNAAQKVGNAY